MILSDTEILLVGSQDPTLTLFKVRCGISLLLVTGDFFSLP